MVMLAERDGFRWQTDDELRSYCEEQQLPPEIEESARLLRAVRLELDAERRALRAAKRVTAARSDWTVDLLRETPRLGGFVCCGGSLTVTLAHG